MKHLILIGACYLDTILSVSHFPEEDSKLRATQAQVRRGGNCPNSLEVLCQLLAKDAAARSGRKAADGRPVTAAHLVSCLPAKDAASTQAILSSFGDDDATAPALAPTPTLAPARRPRLLSFDHCLYRPDHTQPAASYIIRSAATGSRTIVNHNALPEMTAAEFVSVANGIGRADGADGADNGSAWWHFEGRIPETTLACIQHLRSHQRPPTVVSVEVEKPQRHGLRSLAAEADVVFFSRTWAETEGYADAESCLLQESKALPKPTLLLCTWGADGATALVLPERQVVACPVLTPLPPSRVVDTVGAGDTFVAGILYKLACSGATAKSPSAPTQWGIDPHNVDDVRAAVAFAVDLATRKVQIEGFRGLI